MTERIPFKLNIGGEVVESTVDEVMPSYLFDVANFFDPGATRRKAVEQIGVEACVQLCVLASVVGTDIQDYGKKIIHCRGKINGDRTVDQLVDEKVLEKEDEAKGWTTPGTPTQINRLFTKIPYSPAYFIRELREKGEDISMFRKQIKTSLPVELQYIKAGNLPLPQKLRKAHIAFSVRYLKSIGIKFRAIRYEDQTIYASELKDDMELMALLNELETDIVLNADEVDVTLYEAEKMYT